MSFWDTATSWAEKYIPGFSKEATPLAAATAGWDIGGRISGMVFPEAKAQVSGMGPIDKVKYVLTHPLFKKGGTPMKTGLPWGGDVGLGGFGGGDSTPYYLRRNDAPAPLHSAADYARAAGHIYRRRRRSRAHPHTHRATATHGRRYHYANRTHKGRFTKGHGRISRRRRR